MPRMSPADRRVAIVDAALRVMVRKGIASTTARDVAAELECSSGLIHHYFSSMDELLAEAFEVVAAHDLAVAQAAIESENDPLDRLSAFIDSYGRADEHWAFQLWLDAWAEAARRPALQATSRRLNVAWQQLLATVIAGGVAGDRWACPDVDATAWRVLSLLDGLALQSVAHGDLLTNADVVAWAAASAEFELGLHAGTVSTRTIARHDP